MITCKLRFESKYSETIKNGSGVYFENLEVGIGDAWGRAFIRKRIRSTARRTKTQDVVSDSADGSDGLSAVCDDRKQSLRRQATAAAVSVRT